jgi:hypothetical protein
LSCSGPVNLLRLRWWLFSVTNGAAGRSVTSAPIMDYARRWIHYTLYSSRINEK